jgi:hypothetical protein
VYIEAKKNMGSEVATTPKIIIDFNVIEEKHNVVKTEVFLNGSNIVQSGGRDGAYFEIVDEGTLQSSSAKFNIKDMPKSLDEFQIRWKDIGKKPVTFTYEKSTYHKDTTSTRYGNYSVESSVYGKIEVIVQLSWIFEKSAILFL